MTQNFQNIRMSLTDTRTVEVTVYESDSVTVKNITGLSVVVNFRNSLREVVFSKTTAGATVTLTDPVNGVFRFQIAPADLSGLGAYAYFWEATVDADEVISGNLTVI